jgi:hypothetical protein
MLCDTGSNYSATILRGYGAQLQHSVIDTSTTSGYACDTPGNTQVLHLMCIFHIMNYSNTTTYKTTLGIRL